MYEQAPSLDWDEDEQDEPPPPPTPTPEENARARRLALAQLVPAIGGFVALRVLLEWAGVFERVARVNPAWEIPAHVFIQGGIALAVTALVLRLSRQSAASIGVARPESAALAVGRGFMLVGTIYVVMVPLMLATMMLIRGPARESMVQQKTEVLREVARIPLAALFPSAVMAGVYEEVFVRGLLQSRVATVLAGARRESLVARYGAVFIASALFGLGHWYQGPVGVLQTTVVGLILGVSAVVWRSIWPAVVAHVVIDTVGLLVSRVLLPATQGLLQR